MDVSTFQTLTRAQIAAILANTIGGLQEVSVGRIYVQTGEGGTQRVIPSTILPFLIKRMSSSLLPDFDYLS